MAISAQERDPEVGDHPEIANGQIVADQRMGARILDDQRFPQTHDMLAERMGERRLTLRRERLGETNSAFEELPIGGYEGD